MFWRRVVNASLLSRQIHFLPFQKTLQIYLTTLNSSCHFKTRGSREEDKKFTVSTTKTTTATTDNRLRSEKLVWAKRPRFNYPGIVIINEFYTVKAKKKLSILPIDIFFLQDIRHQNRGVKAVRSFSFVPLYTWTVWISSVRLTGGNCHLLIYPSQCQQN